ncbi:MAG: single-stranded-DNA-specific exonuclease RecJ [Candidatus Brocadiia bacterium]
MATDAASRRRSATGKRWVFRDGDRARRDALAEALGISPVLAHLLVTRGLGAERAARRFLAPELAHLHEPDLLPDVAKAAERIRQAVAQGERVLVYGDYDADGVTATALLLQLLRLLGLQPVHYIPSRLDEGYGVHADAVEAAGQQGVDLIVTVDCGTGAVDEVRRARELGIDVVVTDHHEPGRAVAGACAVVNPKLTGSLYPFRDLSGVGVAFKLAWAVAQTFSPGKRVTADFRSFLLDAMGLVALGTVADVVPLRGENRVLAHYGLHALGHSRSPGIAALVEQAGVAGRPLAPSDVSFKLGPRLNAAGRLAEADLCVELLTCDCPRRAADIARTLEAKNRERRRVQAAILAAARGRLAEGEGWQGRRAIVLADPQWHPGVVGIVAAKLAEEFHRPTVLLCVDGDVARGSGRSVPPFNLFEAIEACEDELLAYGGHAQAAGLSLELARLEAFRRRFEEQAQAKLAGWEPCGMVEIDAEVALGAVGRGLVRELERLAPYGEGNPPPVLVASDVLVAGVPRLMGRQGQHLSFYARQGEASFRAVGFGMGELFEEIAGGNVTCDIAFTPQVNAYRGLDELELRLHDLRVC